MKMTIHLTGRADRFNEDPNAGAAPISCHDGNVAEKSDEKKSGNRKWYL